MSRVFGLAVLIASVACTRHNPAATCPNGTCIDSAYPFCDVDGSIGGVPGACISVACAPGAFAECRGESSLTCNSTGNNYDVVDCTVGCVADVGCNQPCMTNIDCTTGICKENGICALETEIAYTLPVALPMADCSKANPCSLDKALQTMAACVLLADGNYQLTGTLTITLKRKLVGQGARRTIVRSTQPGPIFWIDVGADATFDSLQVADATSNTTAQIYGHGVYCPAMPPGTRSVRFVDSIAANNAASGITAVQCDVTLLRSSFAGNTFGVYASTGSTTADRCTFSGNASTGLLLLMNTSIAVTNSFMVRNFRGAQVANPTGTVVFDFNTVVDNTGSGAFGFDCATTAGVTFAANNNVITRNTTDVSVDNTNACTFPGSLISSDVTTLHFVSPDTVPYDYHVMAGSIAINAAINATLDHDCDGDSRPRVAGGWDVGADQY